MSWPIALSKLTLKPFTGGGIQDSKRPQLLLGLTWAEVHPLQHYTFPSDIVLIDLFWGVAQNSFK